MKEGAPQRPKQEKWYEHSLTEGSQGRRVYEVLGQRAARLPPKQKRLTWGKALMVLAAGIGGMSITKSSSENAQIPQSFYRQMFDQLASQGIPAEMTEQIGIPLYQQKFSGDLKQDLTRIYYQFSRALFSSQDPSVRIMAGKSITAFHLAWILSDTDQTRAREQMHAGLDFLKGADGMEHAQMLNPEGK